MERGTLSVSPDPILVTHTGSTVSRSKVNATVPPRINKQRWKNLIVESRGRDVPSHPDYFIGVRMGVARTWNFTFQIYPTRESSPLMKLPLITTNCSSLSNRLPIIEGGRYANENEIARYSRAGVLVPAGDALRCPRDSTRTEGVEKFCESCFGAIWSLIILNYVHL